MSAQRQLAAPAYLVALALMFIPPIDTVGQVLPLRPNDVRWRFAFFGLISNSLMLSLTGLLIAYLIASLFEHRRVQRVLGAGSMLAMTALLGGLATFALDTAASRRNVEPASTARIPNRNRHRVCENAHRCSHAGRVRVGFVEDSQRSAPRKIQQGWTLPHQTAPVSSHTEIEPGGRG